MLNEKEGARDGAKECKSEEAETMKDEGGGDRKQVAIFLSQLSSVLLSVLVK